MVAYLNDVYRSSSSSENENYYYKLPIILIQSGDAYTWIGEISQKDLYNIIPTVFDQSTYPYPIYNLTNDQISKLWNILDKALIHNRKNFNKSKIDFVMKDPQLFKNDPNFNGQIKNYVKGIIVYM